MKMKKLILPISILVLLFSSIIVLQACNKKPEGQMSSSTLNITKELSSYDENSEREKFAQVKEIEFAKDSHSEYKIVIPNDCTEIVSNSAKILSDYLNQIISSQDCFPVITENEYVNGPYISIFAFKNKIDISSIKNDGYIIKSIDKNIYLFTSEQDYIENAIYGFLEDILQCMFTMPYYDYIPNFNTIYLDELNIVSNPDFAWRKVFQYEVCQNNWLAKLKNNGAVDGDVEKIKNWGTWCHNVFTFVDPTIYMSSHPEYFSYHKNEPTQLCLTNPDIYPIIENKMQQLINEHPENKYWDFSINDNIYYCKCKNCNQVLEETGSMMGTMLPIINKLAKKFPDKIISTLAYTYNEKVPKGMTCEPNVNIVLAPIASGQLYSYKFAGNEKAVRTKKLLESWKEICNNILIWDYVVDFRHLLMPFPNFDVQKDNHDFYLENNVKAVFHQGSREYNNEMAELRSYVLSKQLWDNDIDINKTIAKYLKVTYGKAASKIAEYLDKCNSELKSKAKDLDLYDNVSNHQNDYLSSKNIDSYLSTINQAIELEKDNSDIVQRIEKIKINILYAQMNESNWNIPRKTAAYNEFKDLVIKHKIKQPHEGKNPTMEEYLNDIYPKEIIKIKIYISCCVILPVITITCISVALYIIKKKRKQKNI